MPAGHATQTACATLLAYIPGEHVVQVTEPVDEKVPEGHAWQDVFDMDPIIREKVPAGHFVQYLDSNVSE